MATTSSSNDAFDTCITCSSKHNRIRPALCHCKHCFKSFCFDCMKDHNDDIQYNIAQISNQYNELRELINTKRKLIKNESIKSKEQMSEWLKKYIANLIAEKEKIDIDIEKVEEEAQKFVLDIEAQLQTLSPDLEAFTKNSSFQSAHMGKLLKKLDELIQQLSTIKPERNYDLPSSMPQYKFKFNYSPQSTAGNIPQTWKTSEKQHHEQSKTTEQPKVEERSWGDWPVADTETWGDEDSNASLSDENYFLNRDRFENTSYIVNCMASDGIDIMYSTIEDPECERIAFCYLDTNDSNYRQEDPSRIWKQSRIVDMIWWDSIDKFVCATNTGIYTIEYLDKIFRIFKAINMRLEHMYIAANTNYIWVHATGEFMVYNTVFQVVRSINLNLPRSLTIASFCLTDTIVAIGLVRRIQNARDILQISFYDFDMNREKTVSLGISGTSCVIRTDGNDRFYLAMGQQRFYIVSSNGNKEIVNLGKQASCLAVVNSQSIVLTKARSNLELVKC